jgi:hypothetical protein
VRDVYKKLRYQPIKSYLHLFGVDEYRFILNLPNPSTLSAGTYWVEICNDTTTITDDFFWKTGTLDPTHGIAGCAFAFEAPGTTGNKDSFTNLTLQIKVVPPKAMPWVPLLLLGE